MYVVAIDRVTADPAEAARALAEVTGRTPYECRPRVQVPDGGPAVISTHAERDAADEIAARARAAGFHATVVDAAEVAARVKSFIVRSLELGPERITLRARDGRWAEVPHDRLALVVRGTATTQERHTEKVTERKLDVGRALLSGGLIASRKHTSEHTTTTTDSEGFAVVYAAGSGPWWCGEGELDYTTLGAAMQPSRLANWNHVLGELRARAKAAVWDESLLRVAMQRQVLGPTLRAEDDIALAVALVAARRQAPAD